MEESRLGTKYTPGKGSSIGAWSNLQIISLVSSVDLLRIPKARTSGKWLPIDLNFISIGLGSAEKSRLN